MRFEGKHRFFKNAARRSSFKNILKSLAEHHQRLMAYNLYYNSSFASVSVSIGSGMHYLLKFQIFTRLNLFVAQPLTSLGGLAYSRVIMTDYPYILKEKLYRYSYILYDTYIITV